MVSMRLIAQYPNVGNSGHIFLVPPGQMQGALAIGEKINTQMLSLEKEVLSDSELDKAISLKSIKGHDFISVIYPVKQILSEKGTERVGYVWIACEGFDVTVYEDQIPKLLKSLSGLIPKLDSVVARLGYLDSNVARCIELPEMGEWIKSTELKESTIKRHPIHSNLEKTKISIKPIFRNFIIYGVILAVVALCIIFINYMQYDDKLRGSPGNNQNQSIVLKEINKLLADQIGYSIDDKDLKDAAKYFKLSEKDILGKLKQEEGLTGIQTDSDKNLAEIVARLYEFKSSFTEYSTQNLGDADRNKRALDFQTNIKSIISDFDEFDKKQNIPQKTRLIEFLKTQKKWQSNMDVENKKKVYEYLIGLISSNFKPNPFQKKSGSGFAPFNPKSFQDLQDCGSINEDFLNSYECYRDMLNKNGKSVIPVAELKESINRIYEISKNIKK